MLESGALGRKTIKQTVMTSVYGVTLIGAKAQIKKQLQDKNIFDYDKINSLSLYLAKKTIESIGTLFKEAELIMHWLAKCGLIIGKEGNSVKWINPLNLPCIQPYKKITLTELVRTHSQGIMISKEFSVQPVNERKQGTAFPPNYIHSLDSTHMMFTCERAIKEGIVFSSVHDSYWAHPCDLDRLGVILREEVSDNII